MVVSMSDEVKRLKDEGNAFFIKKDYIKAASLYSEALLLDENNAILYANRAACRLALGEHMDAFDDAKKATEIDPFYAKGWSRGAAILEAMSEFVSAAKMYQKAIDVLSKLQSPTEMELKLQKQCEDKLFDVRKAAKLPRYLSEAATEVRQDEGMMPWQAAHAAIPDLVASNTLSSAFSIHFANMDFTHGLQDLKLMERIPVKGGTQMMFKAKTGVLGDFSNAILRDSRVLRIEEGDFLARFAEQVQCERNQWKGFSFETGPEALQEMAIVRLKKEGWDSLRPALSVQIRHWVVIGFIAHKVTSNYTFAVESLRNALNFLTWGRKVWKDVSKEERGTIFDITFRRGVWNLYLDSLMAALGPDRRNISLLETLFEEAEAVIKDVDQNPFDASSFNNPDPGFILSFFSNIKANALASKAFYHATMGQIGQDCHENPRTVKGHLKAAMNLYIDAANCLPEDDENHPWFLNCAYNFMESSNVSASRVMKVLARIRLALPKMEKIWWQNAQAPKPAWKSTYARLMKIEERAKLLIAEKTMTLNGPFVWKVMQGISVEISEPPPTSKEGRTRIYSVKEADELALLEKDLNLVDIAQP
ncbi:hypothetical protein BDP27DRAFT_1326133 [Rhodocollybia butyracea]|uniref:Uncharacterized protein n=1 Tax=Rhodocollybia butyracea TaxID=206335 RepID=A0A9P5PTK8_9AGAR|nr:hypothetical protein BDP27DRAFT_1326133 [Rhodocollybia butyracea]